MNFSVNFVEKATAVLKEAIQLKKYKAMPLVWAIIVGVFMLPVAIASAVCGALVYVFGYLFSVVSLPVTSLHKLLHDEGQNVKHATQFLVYLLSWGFVFATYASLTFFMIILTVLYSLFSIFTYLWTLGGFKFHLFTTEEDLAVEVSGNYHTLIPIIFVAAMGTLLIIVPLITSVVFLIQEKPDITFKLLTNLFKAKLHETDTLRFLFSVAYSAIMFAPGPKKIAE